MIYHTYNNMTPYYHLAPKISHSFLEIINKENAETSGRKNKVPLLW